MNKMVSLGVLLSAKDMLSPVFKKATNNLGKFETKMKAAAITATKFGAGSAAIGTAMLAPLKSFYDDYTQIAKKEGELESLSIGAKGISTITAEAKKFTNQFARISAPEFLTAAYDIKSGISSLSDEGVAKMTAMSSMTAQATKATGSEMSKLFALGHGIFGKDFAGDFDFADKFSAAISTSVQAFRTDGSDLSLGLSNIGAAAKSMGVSLEEELAIIGVGKSVFNSASEAGTGYRAFLTGAGKAQEKLGLTFVDSNGKMLPMVDILEKIKEKYTNLESVETKDLLKEAFGSDEATKLISGLIDKTDDLTSAQASLSKNMKKGASVTQEMADKMNKGYGVELMTNRLVNLTSTIGSKLEPMVSSITTKIGNIAIKISDWMEKNEELSSTIITVGAGIGAVLLGLGTFSLTLGAIALLTPSLISAIGLVSGAVSFLGKAFLFNPIGLAITAIGLAALGIYTYWTPIKGFFINLWSGISNSFKKGVSFIFSAWTPVKSFFKSTWSGIKSIFSQGVTFIQDYLGWTPIGMIINNWTPIKNFFSNFWSGVKSTFNMGVSSIYNLFSNALTVISEYWTPIKGFFSSFWNGTKTIFSAGASYITSVFKSAAAVIKKPFVSVFDWFVKKFNWLENKISTLIKPLKGFTSEIGSKIGGFFKNASNLFTFDGGYKKEKTASKVKAITSTLEHKKNTRINVKEPVNLNLKKRNMSPTQNLTIQKIEINNPSSTVDVQKGVASGLLKKPISLNDDEEF